MFLAPFALTIFGFSTSSASSERFSRGASAGAVSDLLGFAGLFAGFAAAATGAAVLGVGVGCAASSFTSAVGDCSSACGFFVASSALGLAGFLCSAILIISCLLLLFGFGFCLLFCVFDCVFAHLSL